MSKSELVRFCNEYLPQHADLKQRIAAGGDKQVLAKGLALAGAEAGFDFSEAEILAVIGAPRAELSDSELEVVAGGRKAGGTQEEYLIVKLQDLLVTS